MINSFLFDAIGGDILLEEINGSLSIRMSDSDESLLNLIIGRLKDQPEDYGTSVKYNLYRYLGQSGERLEQVIESSIINMLTFDNLVRRQDLEVQAILKNGICVLAIKIRSESKRKGYIELMFNIDSEGNIINYGYN